MPIEPSRPVDPGEIFWVNLPQQIGSEQHGRRPCIVISRRALNNANTVVVVPMSTNIERANSHRVMIPVTEIIKDPYCTTEIKPSVALCHQVRAVDKRAFDNKIGNLSQNAVLAVQLGLQYLF